MKHPLAITISASQPPPIHKIDSNANLLPMTDRSALSLSFSPTHKLQHPHKHLDDNSTMVVAADAEGLNQCIQNASPPMPMVLLD